MRVRMIVSFHLVLQILHFLLQLLKLVFQRLDPLVIIGMMVTVLCLGHSSSLNAGMIVIQFALRIRILLIGIMRLGISARLPRPSWPYRHFGLLPSGSARATL
jgi:hypothetical protein